MHFQIYIPRAADVAESLVDVGLAHLASEFDARLIVGPDGGRGALFSWLKPGSTELGYQAERQTWTPAAAAGDLASGRYWLGLWNDSPPTPADLARTYQQPGKPLQLGDGRTWIIPRVAELPRDVQLADDGTLRFVVQRKFHAFYVVADAWRQRLAAMNPDDPEAGNVDYVELWEFANQALEINYRTTPEVVSALSLFSTETIGRPLYAVLNAEGGK